MNEKIKEALNEISDRHISEAATYQHRKPYWLGAVAAILAAVILLGSMGSPVPIEPGDPTVSLPLGAVYPPHRTQLVNLVKTVTYPSMAACPDRKSYNDEYAYQSDYLSWQESQRLQHNQPDGYADSLTDFFSRSIPRFLQGNGNRAYSPINYYIALAMLAETAQGNSRQQILDLLNVDSIEALRTQASHVWNAHYNNDGKNTSLLANSLWLDNAYNFHQSAVDVLTDNYHAGVFHGDLDTESMNQQLRSWIDSQTGDFLQEHTQNLKLDSQTVFALASTIYFRSTWTNKFSKDATKNAIFHCVDKEINTPFMNDTFIGTYYQGKNFGAISLSLSDGSCMWLILPYEEYSVQDILGSDEYLQLTLNPTNWAEKENRLIYLSVPKFDISSNTDLIEGTKNLGVTDVFSAANADLGNLVNRAGSNENVYVNQVDHAIRIAIDEDGITAASYTLIGAPGTGMPPEPLEITFDRPFLFIVSSADNLPLFAGTVMEP